MRLSDYLLGVGEPLYYYPPLAKIVGGVKSAVLLCRLIQWYGHQAAEDGGIYKTQTDICAETGMTDDEQVGARKALRQCGVIREHYKRIEHKLYFYIEFDKLNELWEENHRGISPNLKNGFPETHKQAFPKPEKKTAPPLKSGQGQTSKAAVVHSSKLTTKLTDTSTSTGDKPDRNEAAVAVLLEEVGMDEENARECAANYSVERIEDAIQTMEWKRLKGKCDSPGGFIYDMLKRDWAVPKAVVAAKRRKLLAEGNEVVVREQALLDQTERQNLTLAEQHVEQVMGGMTVKTRAIYLRKAIEAYKKVENDIVLKMIEKSPDPTKLSYVRCEMVKCWDIDNGKQPSK